MNLIWQKQNWMTVFASLLYQLFPSNVDEIGVWSLQASDSPVNSSRVLRDDVSLKLPPPLSPLCLSPLAKEGKEWKLLYGCMSWRLHGLLLRKLDDVVAEPKTPLLQTSLRAHPPKVKTSLELEQEELEKIPKFKAIPLNKKIFESKGDIGVFCLTKKHVSEPQEFHFATDERIPPPAAMADLFGKLSLNSEPSRNHNPIPRNTTPNPFHLHTEKRGAEKEKKLAMDLLQKQWEEENARIPKAHPYPYTTDYPVSLISYADPSKTRTKAMHKTKAIPIGEPGDTRG
ncbi:hypothetical protein JHK85_051098 [Glycine max]|nr:hypothetical protein JHK85_051098 [Glycine max]